MKDKEIEEIEKRKINKKRRFYTVMFVDVTVTWAYMGIPVGVACNWHSADCRGGWYGQSVICSWYSADCKANGDTLVVVVVVVGVVVVGGGGGWFSWAIVSNSL